MARQANPVAVRVRSRSPFGSRYFGGLGPLGFPGLAQLLLDLRGLDLKDYVDLLPHCHNSSIDLD
jgi:hypothetical protein